MSYTELESVYRLAQLVRADPAFLDRADIVQYIDVPPPEAIYDILRSCLLELMHRGMVIEKVCYV